MSAQGDDEDMEISGLGLADLVLINNALNEIINGPSAIAPCEFQTRTGAEIEDARQLLSRIGILIKTRSAH